MKNTGWEIQPLGWLLILATATILVYVVVHWVNRSVPPTKEKKP